MGIRSSARCALIALVATALVPVSPVRAQLGGAVGVRIITNATESVRNTERKGYEARVYYDRDFTPRFGLTGEFSYVQMQYKRDVDTATFQVSENGLEAGLYFRAESLNGWSAGGYFSAGVVASSRFFCGAVGLWGPHGRVACDESDAFMPGAMLGVGTRWPGATSDVTFDVRWMQHTVAAGGGALLSLSVGVRRRKAFDDDDSR